MTPNTLPSEPRVVCPHKHQEGVALVIYTRKRMFPQHETAEVAGAEWQQRPEKLPTSRSAIHSI